MRFLPANGAFYNAGQPLSSATDKLTTKKKRGLLGGRADRGYMMGPMCTRLRCQDFGRMTASITWMTPLEVSISAVTTFAPSTLTPSVASMEILSP